MAEELKKGTPFETLSAEYSAAPNAQQGGDIGYVGRGQLPQVFEDELFRLRPGSISRIVRTDSGFHLFKVEDYRRAGKLDFAAAEPLIRTRIREEAAEPADGGASRPGQERNPSGSIHKTADVPLFRRPFEGRRRINQPVTCSIRYPSEGKP